MSRKKDIDLDLTGFAELFMNDEGRAESRLPRIYDIPLLISLQTSCKSGCLQKH